MGVRNRKQESKKQNAQTQSYKDELKKNGIVTEKSFVQVEIDLNKPLDKDQPPTIFSSQLKPEYATAALNLAGDFLKQDESHGYKYVFWHPLVSVSVFLMTVLHIRRSYDWPIQFISVSQYLSEVYVLNKRSLLTSLIVFAVSLTLIFQLFTRFVKMYYGDRIADVEELKGEGVFQVNLEKLANLNKETVSQVVTLNNCNIILYRDAPIAMVVIDTRSLTDKDEEEKEEKEEKKDKKEPVVVIASIGARKVYLESGILEDLLQWSILRTSDLLKTSSVEKTTISIETHPYNISLKKALQKTGFKITKTESLENQFILSKLLGIKKQTWTYEVSLE